MCEKLTLREADVSSCYNEKERRKQNADSNSLQNLRDMMHAETWCEWQRFQFQ